MKIMAKKQVVSESDYKKIKKQLLDKINGNAKLEKKAKIKKKNK